MKENYYDGTWRPLTDSSDAARLKLLNKGFVIGNDEQGRLMARWPIAPAAPITFSNAIVIEYWRDEIQRGCAASLERLREICAERGADYDRTVAELKGA